MKNQMHFAVLSGCCASAASIFGKMYSIPALENYWILKILAFVLMLVCNAGVWTLFVKALSCSESTLIPTVISSASNYTLSIVAGILIFGETVNLLLWTGMGCILLGLLLILNDQEKHKPS